MTVRRRKIRSDSTEKFFEDAFIIKRDGVKELLDWLEGITDFFTAPASTKFHGAYEGGLVDHSLAVHEMARMHAEVAKLGSTYWESIAICSLFHDVCKVDTYVKDDEDPSDKQVKYFVSLCAEANIDPPDPAKLTKGYLSMAISALKDGKKLPPLQPTYKVKDALPLGHGEKSIFLINRFMDLTNEEALAIRWHLGGFDPAVHFGYPYGMTNRQAFKENKLVPIIACADLAASYLIDKWGDEEE